MGKEQNPRRVADNEAMAKTKMLRTSPQKLNLVAAMIRGKKVDKALADLSEKNRDLAVARAAAGVIRSAASTPPRGRYGRCVTRWECGATTCPRVGSTSPASSHTGGSASGASRRATL